MSGAQAIRIVPFHLGSLTKSATLRNSVERAVTFAKTKAERNTGIHPGLDTTASLQERAAIDRKTESGALANRSKTVRHTTINTTEPGRIVLQI